MQHAHARLERGPDELSDGETYPPLRAVTETRDTQRSSDPLSRPLVELDELFDTHSAGRSVPRRPTGAAADYARSTTGAPRRTVRIGGHGAQTALRPTPSELRGPRPDRIAAWGVGFGIFVALLAALVGG